MKILAKIEKGLVIIAVSYSAVIIAVTVVGVNLIHNITDTTTRTMVTVTVINAVLTASLVGLTAMYAYSTQKIYRATKEQASEIQKQAKATSEMATATKAQADATAEIAKFTKEQANEMRLQRLAEKPFVVPDINIEPGYTFVKEFVKGLEIKHVEFPVAITNAGKEAAVELELSLKLPLEPPKEDGFYGLLSVKMPLLMPGTTWKGLLTYAPPTPEEGDELENLHPPEGQYELKVCFRPISSLETKPSTISLIFSLSFITVAKKRILPMVRLERHKLIQN